MLTFWYLAKFGVFTGSHLHWPRKDLGRFLGKTLSLQNYRQRFSWRGVQQRELKWRNTSWMHQKRLPLRLFGPNSPKMGRFIFHWVVFIYFYLCSDWIFFHFYSFNVPEGLIMLLRDFTLKRGETPADSRARLYKQLWCLLWVSWNIFRHTIHPEIIA